MRVLLLLGTVGAFWHFATGGTLPSFKRSERRPGAVAGYQPIDDVRLLEMNTKSLEEAVLRFRAEIRRIESTPVRGCNGQMVCPTITPETYANLGRMEQQLAQMQDDLRRRQASR